MRDPQALTVAYGIPDNSDSCFLLIFALLSKLWNSFLSILTTFVFLFNNSIKQLKSKIKILLRYLVNNGLSIVKLSFQYYKIA